ncbi:hypothetical protein DQG13_06335 [Paenibacillus sp. YN15]|nr:hypothetical protein DQG13_06335 [Paenibacillus sp. YN15]
MMNARLARQIGRGLLALALLVPLVQAAPEKAEAANAATVTVNAGSIVDSSMNNPSWYLNQSGLKSASTAGPSYWENLKNSDTRYVRAWFKPTKYYNRTTGVYNYDYQNSYMEQLGKYAQRIILNVDQCDQADMGFNPSTMTITNSTACRNVLKNGIKEYKKRYPQIEYIEAFNEPDKDWDIETYEMPAVPPKSSGYAPSPKLYYEWYKVFYSVINEINAELNPPIPLKLGGPALGFYNTTYIDAFLNAYRDDTNPNKRLDFISYHQYRQRGTGVAENPGPAAVKNERSILETKLTNRGLDPQTKVFVTEYGVFPGPATGPKGHSDNTQAQDQLTQAAAMATTGMYYVEGGMTMPMHWTIDHGDNPRKDMFVDGLDGVPLPYYNVLKMQSMLKTSRIASSTSAGALNATTGLGVHSLATRDDSGIAVMFVNYQWDQIAAGQGMDYNVTTTINNIPASLFSGSRKMRLERYQIDNTNSNYNSGAANAPLKKIEDVVLDYSSTLTRPSFYMGKNTITLMVLTPVHRYELESSAIAKTVSSGDSQTNVSDAAASGGAFNKFDSNAVGDYVEYTLNVPQTGTYAVMARVKKGADRGKFELTVDGAIVGSWKDLYAADQGFEEIYIGNKYFGAAGSKKFRLTVKDRNAASSGYSAGFDFIELVPRSAVTYELEQLSPQVGIPTQQDPYYFISDTTASGGKFVKYAATGAGANNNIRFLIHVKEAGEYKLYVSGKTYTTRGKYQVYVDGAALGGVQDQYATTEAYADTLIGKVVFDKPGVKEIKLQITGKNSASTGYDLSLDTLRLEP